MRSARVPAEDSIALVERVARVGIFVITTAMLASAGLHFSAHAVLYGSGTSSDAAGRGFLTCKYFDGLRRLIVASPLPDEGAARACPIVVRPHELSRDRAPATIVLDTDSAR